MRLSLFRTRALQHLEAGARVLWEARLPSTRYIDSLMCLPRSWFALPRFHFASGSQRVLYLHELCEACQQDTKWLAWMGIVYW